MTGKRDLSESAGKLRQRAEERARQDEARMPEDIAALSPKETGRVLHELRVHQIELEMQNEELRQALAELEASRARYFDLYDLAPVGYLTLGERGSILEANLTAATLLSVARSSLVNQPIFRFIHNEDQDIYYRHRKQLVETGEPQLCELRMVSADDRTMYVQLDATAAKDESGALVCRVALSDISEHKRVEEEHKRLQAQLIQAQKMESVGRLAGGVAHDFNNMLSVIIGNAELAMSKLRSHDPLQDTLQEILNAAEHSTKVTRQLLAFARKQIISPRVLDLNETVEGMLQMLRRLIGEDIDLSWRPAKGLWMIRMDPSQIDQILANLCVNARDAIAGVGNLTIETANVSIDESVACDHNGSVGGDFVQLTVIDDGCGMNRHALENVFEPFFTTKEVDKGTGLGLATIYGIVKQNSGFIDVRSEPEKGTTFKIYLPRDKTIAEPICEIRDPVASDARGGGTVLLVEDEPAILRMAMTMIERLGYIVLPATTPGEAIRLAEAYPGKIDLLLTDLVMPEMNGRNLAKQLLTLYPHLKCLFMSGYPADIIAEGEMLEAGAQFIQKPFSMRDFGAKVRAVMGMKSKAGF